jgi:hypothetical protein
MLNANWKAGISFRFVPDSDIANRFTSIATSGDPSLRTEGT